LASSCLSFIALNKCLTTLDIKNTDLALKIRNSRVLLSTIGLRERRLTAAKPRHDGHTPIRGKRESEDER
jgi:hypothetical protein